MQVKSNKIYIDYLDYTVSGSFDVKKAVPRAQNNRGRQRLQNSLDLQTNLRQWKNSFHRLQTPYDQKDGLPWRDYVYDEYYDCVICPEYKILHYTTTTRDGYRQYKSKGYQCQVCPSLQ